VFQSVLNSKWVKGQKALGVELYINSDGQFDISCVVLSLKKNKVTTENKIAGLTQINDLKQVNVQNLPVALSIDGKGVLFKKVERVNQKKLIHHLLPNAKETEFHVQQIQTGENHVIISAVRKEILENILNQFIEQKFYITNLFIGPLAVKNLISAIDKNEIVTNRYKIIKDDDYIVEIDKLSKATLNTYIISNEAFHQNELIPFATALSFYIDDIQDDNPIAETRREFLYKKAFQLAGWFTLIFFFLLLMVNYFFFNRYNTRYNSLSFSLNQNKELIKKLDTLKSEYLLKEQYFVKSGFLDASKLSYYTDRLAYSLPDEIQLISMKINPLAGKIKNDKPIEFNNKTITISGNVSQSIFLNNWVKKIKEFDWVEQVNIVDYMQESSESVAVFELEIKLK